MASSAAGSVVGEVEEVEEVDWDFVADGVVSFVCAFITLKNLPALCESLMKIE